ncbi:hypothetical protein [Pseudomonas sp. COR18]|uniref:hypothetical protein n=1 Tax=Pseudomonas sp. COR18 TaxID=3399680 RepID=UPI003B003977
MIQEKLRDWQIRRLEVKERMHAHPEQTLELSRVLDLMDEEHAAILAGSASNQVQHTAQTDLANDRAVPVEHSSHSVAGTFELQLHVAAANPDHFLKLLEMAVHELQGQINAQRTVSAGQRSRNSGDMSGTLGSYHFELDVSGGVDHG